MKTILIAGIILHLSLSCFAQERDLDKLTPKKKFKLTNSLINKKSYYNATHHLRTLVEENLDNKTYVHALADAYFYSRDYKNAEIWYVKAVGMDGKDITDAYFRYAESLKYNGKYVEAMEAFKTFAHSKYKDKPGQKLKLFAKNEVESCKFALKNINESEPVSITHTGPNINSAYSDFAPYLKNDSILIFATLRADTVVTVEPDDINPHLVKLVRSTKNASGEWSNSTELPIVNNQFTNTANGTYSNDFSKFYFTRCYSRKDGKMICAIYVSKVDAKGNFTKPQKLDGKINRKGYTSTQPSIGMYKVGKSEMDVLYYVSDKPGGRGGMDIWYSVVDKKGVFKKSQNAGVRINTARDEITPFYDSKNEILYFSSNYHYGFGGFDVFSSNGKLNRWESPVNVGRPINSRVDETYYTFYPKKRNGFFVSNRPEGYHLTSETCCDDIYAYEIRNPYILRVKASASEGDSKNIRIEVFENFSQNSYEDYLSAKYAKDSLEVNNKKELLSFISDNNKSLRNKNLIPNFTQHPYSEQEEWTDFYTLSPNKEFIVFATDLGDTSVYYIKTSENAADFKVISSSDGLNKHSYFNNELIDIIEVSLTLEAKDNQQNQATVSKTSGYNPDDYTVKKLAEKVKTDITSELKVILNYDFDDTKFIEKNAGSLDSIIAIIKEYPSLKVHIDAHTDNKGSHTYNINLSERRAQSILNYMITKGIKEARITTKGHAATIPLVPNTNPDGSDSPENRYLNRRAEIILLNEQ